MDKRVIKENDWDGGCSSEFLLAAMSALRKMYGEREVIWTVEGLSRLGGAQLGAVEHNYRMLPHRIIPNGKVAKQTSDPEKNRG